MITTLNLPDSIKLTSEAFLEFVAANPELQLERTSTGELVIMSPTGGETGDSLRDSFASRNDEVSFQLRAWNKQTKLGKTFNSSTGFTLPNGATRAPDASWVRLDRWLALTSQQREAFPPCPDFVIELRSPSDNLKKLQAKMQQYVKQGGTLGWLIDPKTKQIEIYRQKRGKEILNQPTTLSGEDILPGFVLDWQSDFDA